MKIFSFDAETDGLWGQVFAIGAVVLDEQGKEIARFIGRLPDKVITSSWVRENILPQLADVPVTHESVEGLLSAFARFYLEHKADCEIVTHMGYIVEAWLLRQMYTMGVIGEWDGPYPLFDVSGNLQAAGDDPTSVDNYAAKNGISVDGSYGTTHNPLYDAVVTVLVYRHLRQREQKI